MTVPSASNCRVLIAGIGNIFLGDDAFGVEVVRLLAERRLPEGVRVIDFGIRGLDLAYALLEPYDVAIFIDAAPRGGKPGTLYVLEPQVPASIDPTAPAPQFSAHGLDPTSVLNLVCHMGGRPPRMLVVGCEPSPLPEADLAMGLSPAVQAAVQEALPLIDSLVAQILLRPDNPPAGVHPSAAQSEAIEPSRR